jgi:hypothetical protein
VGNRHRNALRYDRLHRRTDWAGSTVGWELPLQQFALDKPSEFGRDYLRFVAAICIDFNSETLIAKCSSSHCGARARTSGASETRTNHSGR